MAGSISIGALMGIWNAAIGSFVWPVIDLPELLALYNDQKVSYERLKSEIAEDVDYSQPAVDTAEGMKSLVLQNVSFSYSDTSDAEKNRLILKDASLRFPSSGIHIITGDSGAGKSTLIKLLLGLYDIDGGDISICAGGDTSHELKRYMSYVPQRESVLPLTIKENIILDTNASEQEMYRLCAIAGIHEWITRLPDAYNTYIKDAESMSVGQSFRIAVVRALMQNKPFILMDEPFSGLDEATIDSLGGLLREISKDHGVILVSHRSSSLSIADRVMVMENGGIHVVA
jgi:ABC-type bacteriocin/lantibiotic exporter with double-glycine peptidase domain